MDFIARVFMFLMQVSTVICAIAIFLHKDSYGRFNIPFIEKFFTFIAGSTMLGGAIISFMNSTLDAIVIAFVLLFFYRLVGLFPYRY